MITVNGFQPLTIITKCFILDVAAVLDPPLLLYSNSSSVQLNKPLRRVTNFVQVQGQQTSEKGHKFSPIAGAYLGLCELSMMNLFCKNHILTSFTYHLFSEKSPIIDV